MTEFPPAYEADPGKVWRRLARGGALVCTFSTFVMPINRDERWFKDTLAHMSIEHFSYFAAWTQQIEQLLSGKWGHLFWTYIIFACLVGGLVLLGPTMLLLTDRRGLRPGHGRYPHCIAAIALWLISSLPPYFSAIALARLLQEPLGMTATLSLLSLYLLLAGLAFLASWHRRGSTLFVFWLGLWSIIIATLGATFLLAFCVHKAITFGGSMGVLAAITEWLGCCGLLLCWLLWWRAVARHEAARTQAATP